MRRLRHEKVGQAASSPLPITWLGILFSSCQKEERAGEDSGSLSCWKLSEGVACLQRKQAATGRQSSHHSLGTGMGLAGRSGSQAGPTRGCLPGTAVSTSDTVTWGRLRRCGLSPGLGTTTSLHQAGGIRPLPGPVPSKSTGQVDKSPNWPTSAFSTLSLFSTWTVCPSKPHSG